MPRPNSIPLIAATLLAACAPSSQATTQADVDQATLEQSYWQAKAASAQAQSTVASTKLGTLSTSGLTKPSGEASDLNVEANLLAYSAADKVADTIAARIKTVVGDRPVVFYSDKEINALEQTKAFLASLQGLDKTMEKFAVPSLAVDKADCKEPALGGAAIGPLGVLSIGLQIASLFNVDKKMAGTAVTIDDFALVALVARKLHEHDVKSVVYPPLYLGHAFAPLDAGPFGGSRIAALLGTLDERKAHVDQVLVQIGSRRDDLKARETDKVHPLSATCKDAIAAARATFTALEAKAATLKANADKLEAAADTLDDKTGASLLQVLVHSEQMSTTLQGAYVLQIKPVAAGGTTLTRTSLFSTSFHFSGGVVVSYMLVDGASGNLQISGTVGGYGGAIEPDKLQSVLRESQP